MALIACAAVTIACVSEAGPAPCTDDGRCLVGFECYQDYCLDCPPGACGGLVTKSIPVTGGTLCGPDEACVEVPPGALTASVTIGIRRSRRASPAIDVRSLVYDIEPVDLRFAVPATVRIPISPSLRLEDMRVYVAPGNTQNFGPLPGTPTQTYAIGATDRLGSFVGARLPARN
jgi:hypothetical protein